MDNDRLLSEQEVKNWLDKWIGYIDEDMIARMKLRTIDIPPAEPQKELIAAIHFDEDKMREICAEIAENIEVKQDWIPCSERLPQEEDYKPSYEVRDGAVLWTNEDDLVGEGYYYESTKTWSDIDDNPVSVTAWMPLPEPYKAESEV